MSEGLLFSSVLITALVDSINPCAIGVLVLLVSTLVGLSEHRKKMIKIGLIYIFMVYIVYFLAGLGLTAFLYQISSNIAQIISVIVAVIVIIAGLIEIKDYFWYGQGFSLSIPVSQAERIKKMMNNVTVPGAVVLGMFVAAVELPCTGGPYLAITTILSKSFDWLAVLYLLIYNFIFVLPLLIILFAVFFGVKAIHVQNWKNKYRKYMRLAMGILLLGLGTLLLLNAFHIITF